MVLSSDVCMTGQLIFRARHGPVLAETRCQTGSFQGNDALPHSGNPIYAATERVRGRGGEFRELRQDDTLVGVQNDQRFYGASSWYTASCAAFTRSAPPLPPALEMKRCSHSLALLLSSISL
jgi:hypothetical protein